MGDINNQRIAAQKADGGGETIFFPAWVLSPKQKHLLSETQTVSLRDKYYGILRQSAADVFILISN